MYAQVKYFSQALLDLIYPRVCPACLINKIDEEPLCLQCKYSLPTVPANALTNPAQDRLQNRCAYQSANAWLFMTKRGIVHNMLHQIKYKYNISLAHYLATQLADWADHVLPPQIDCITAVPIHPKKEKIRGYNQTHILAQAIADKLNKPFRPTLLQKVRNTASQTGYSRLRRLHNLKDSLQLGDPQNVAQGHILLVDDVLTTGSTLETCTQLLLQIPNTKVHLLTLAIADY